jgi:hypothetical protein
MEVEIKSYIEFEPEEGEVFMLQDKPNIVYMRVNNETFKLFDEMLKPDVMYAVDLTTGSLHQFTFKDCVFLTVTAKLKIEL